MPPQGRLRFGWVWACGGLVRRVKIERALAEQKKLPSAAFQKGLDRNFGKVLAAFLGARRIPRADEVVAVALCKKHFAIRRQYRRARKDGTKRILRTIVVAARAIAHEDQGAKQERFWVLHRSTKSDRPNNGLGPHGGCSSFVRFLLRLLFRRHVGFAGRLGGGGGTSFVFGVAIRDHHQGSEQRDRQQHEFFRSRHGQTDGVSCVRNPTAVRDNLPLATTVISASSTCGNLADRLPGTVCFTTEQSTVVEALSVGSHETATGRVELLQQIDHFGGV